MSYTDLIIKLAKEFENKTKNQFVYHLKSPDFRGKYIYPLLKLEEVYPDLYKKELKKYKGRESHPELKIDILNTQWKNCVNFSTLNPYKIFQLEELLGVPGYKNVSGNEFFRFKITDLVDFDMCLYDDNKSPKKQDAYKKISINSYKETEFIPIETAKYFIQSKEKKEYPLLFGNITHLLVKGEIPIDKAKILTFESCMYE